MKRRDFVRGGLALGALGLTTGAYAGLVEPFWLEWVYRSMPLSHLPPELEGKTLMQISDIHVGHRVSESYLVESLRKAATLSPDIVVYTGDFVHYRDEETLTQLRRVAPVFPRGRLATLAILGNHDYGHNWSQPEVADRISRIIEGQQIRVLRNEIGRVEGLSVIGIDDYWGTSFDPNRAFRDLNSDRAAVVLCHNPDVCDLDVWQGYQGWILAGHTHGGQCHFPIVGAPIVPVKNKAYDAGHFDLGDGRQLYINRALGYLHQVRFGVRPEITIFTLTASGQSIT